MSGLGLEAEREDRFRPDLEGLRAVAVVLVMGFHAGLTLVAGGYVGVDVFYVLSGFLITGLLLRELRRDGSISLPAFYARRARRLLPAAAFVLVVVVIASAVLLSPLRLPEVIADAVAAALYVVNLRFATQATDYLGADVTPSPLLHYWSLAVEEQFYLVWPALLLLAIRFRRGSTSVIAVVGIVVVVVGILSFAASLVLTQVAEPWAFFTLPARAWELALGAALAVLAARSFQLPRVAGAVAAVTGLAMIVAAAVLYSQQTPFPGTAALLPSAGAGLVIAAGLGGIRSLPSRLLGLAPMRWVGRISYSLYLWHWPLIVIPVAVAGHDLDLSYRLALAALTFPLAWATTRWIEDPIRRGALTRAVPRRTLALAGTLTIAVVLVSAGVGWLAPLARPTQASTAATGQSPASVPPSNGAAPTTGQTSSLAPSSTAGGLASVLGTPRPIGVPAPSPGPVPRTVGGPVPADVQPPLDVARKDVSGRRASGCSADFAMTQAPQCVDGDPGSKTTVMLIGDSHAAQWFGAFERLASERGWRLIAYTKAACAFIDHPSWNGELKRPYPECTEWGRAVMAVVASERPTLVVLAHTSREIIDINGGPVDEADSADVWDAALSRRIQELRTFAHGVAIISDTPFAVRDPVECLAASLGDMLACARPRRDALAEVRHAHDMAIAQRTGATYIDPDPYVCPSDPCPPIIGNIVVYRDDRHITQTFSRALAPYLLAELPPLD